MKKISYLLILTALTIAACNKPETETVEKIVKIEKTEAVYTGEVGLNPTVWYQTSAENKAIYIQTYKLAKLMLAENAKKKGKKPLAVVTDLDETALDNSPYNARMAKTGNVYANDTWDAWVNTAKATALPGAVDFFNFAKSINVEVFYISNRSQATLKPTMDNMKLLGFPNVEDKYFMLKTDKSDKTARRDSILKTYDIVLYLGDNMTDFTEEFANRDTTDFGAAVVEKYKAEIGTKFIVFPNPMYGEWEKAAFRNDYGKSPAEKLKALKSAIKDNY